MTPTRSLNFGETRWSIVQAAAETQSPTRQRLALEQLVRDCWYPLYSYIRRRGHDAVEAEDLTQSFFTRLLEKRTLAAADRNRGRFRSFLLASVRNFLGNQWRWSRTRKRGGDKPAIAWDALQAEARYRLEPADELTPERLFNRQFALALLERVLACLQDDYAYRGQAELFAALKQQLTGTGDRCSRAETARQLGMSEGAVKTAASRLRKRFREMLRREIAETLASPDMVDEEIAFLMECL